MIQISTPSFAAIKQIVHTMNLDFTVGVVTKKAGSRSIVFQAETQLHSEEPYSEGGQEEGLYHRQYCRLTVSEQADGSFGVDMKIPLSFDPNGSIEKADPILPLALSLAARPSEAQEEINQFVEQKQYGLIEIEMDSFFGVLEEGPDKHGIPYSFKGFELRRFGVNSFVLVPDFTERLYLKLYEASDGRCRAVPYMLVF